MPNIELLENLCRLPRSESPHLPDAAELAEEVDKKLVKFRKELVAPRNPPFPTGICREIFPCRLRMPAFRIR